MFITFREFYSENNEKTNLLNKLIDLAWSRYEPETRDFFENLSKKDPDIKGALEQVESHKNQQEPDVISKNDADSQSGNEDL